MSVAWTSFKIGLLTILVVAASIIIAVALGIRPGPDAVVRYHTYFDESVVGLDVGAAVKYRGIAIGKVAGIDVAPDGRVVHVTLEVDAKKAPLVRWRAEQDDGLRAQVNTPGITGVKLIDLDYVTPDEHPPPDLPFAPREPYLPSGPSFLGGLQQTLATITESLTRTLGHAEALMKDFRTGEIPSRMTAALSAIEGASAELRGTVRRVNQGRIPDKTAETLARLDQTLASVHDVVRRIDADGGLLSEAEQATSELGVVGSRVAGATDELDRTVRDLDDAARAVRSLADVLENDPDMLIKGRKKVKR